MSELNPAPIQTRRCRVGSPSLLTINEDEDENIDATSSDGINTPYFMLVLKIKYGKMPSFTRKTRKLKINIRDIKRRTLVIKEEDRVGMMMEDVNEYQEIFGLDVQDAITSAKAFILKRVWDLAPLNDDKSVYLKNMYISIIVDNCVWLFAPFLNLLKSRQYQKPGMFDLDEETFIMLYEGLM